VAASATLAEWLSGVKISAIAGSQELTLSKLNSQNPQNTTFKNDF